MHGGTYYITHHLADESCIHTMAGEFNIGDSESQGRDSLNLEDAPPEDGFDRCSTTASQFEGSLYKDPDERYHAQGLQPAADNAVQGEISAIHDQRAEAYCNELYNQLCFFKIGTKFAEW